MAASTQLTNGQEATRTALSTEVTNTNQTAKGKGKTRGSSRAASSEDTPETKKKTKSVLSRFRNSLKKKSKSTETSSIEKEAPVSEESSISRDQIPVLPNTEGLSNEILKMMVKQVKITLAFEKELMQKLALTTPFQDLDSFDTSMKTYCTTKRSQFEISGDNETIATPRTFEKHVLLSFQTEQQELLSLEALCNSSKHALDNKTTNVIYEAPDWMDDVLKNRKMFEAIGNCSSMDKLTEEQTAFLSDVHSTLEEADLATLKPLSTPRAAASSSDA